MLAAVVAAAFENIGEAYDVGIDIGVRVDQRMPHAGLRRQMHHIGKPAHGEEARHTGTVGEIELHEFKAGKLGEFGQPCVLQLRIVIGVQVIESDHGLAARQQPARDVIADEARSARHQDGSVSHANNPECDSARSWPTL